MPYRSDKQRRYMHAIHPDIAKRWDKEYGGKIKKKNILSDLYNYYKEGFLKLINKEFDKYISTHPNKGAEKIMEKLQLYPKKQKKQKASIVVNNKMKWYGQMDPKTNKVEINVAKHKGDKTELANSIHHELLHVKYPNMSEKQVKDKADMDTAQMSEAEKNQLVAKVRTKKLHYKQGAMKRKFKMDKSEKIEPGTFISKANQKKLSQKEILAIKGLV